MGLTVGELRKALRGLDKNMPVYTRDHDHAEWETNGLAWSCEVINQTEMSDYGIKSLDENDGVFKIEGDYFVVST